MKQLMELEELHRGSCSIDMSIYASDRFADVSAYAIGGLLPVEDEAARCTQLSQPRNGQESAETSASTIEDDDQFTAGIRSHV